MKIKFTHFILIAASGLMITPSMAATTSTAMANNTPTNTATASTNSVVNTNKTANNVKQSTSINNHLVALYTEPTVQSKVLENVTSVSQLIPIFQQGEWLKVGDKNNGQTGYVNYQQYQKALQAANLGNNVQMVFIQADRSQGSPNYNIVAYRNGQRLSDQEAQTLYAQMSKQQQAFNEQMQAYQANMNKLMSQDMQAFNQTFAAISNMPMVQPMIVVNNIGSSK